MNLTVEWFLREVGETLRNPRAGLRRILSLQLGQRTAWEALLLTVVVSVVLVEVMAMVLRNHADVFGSTLGPPIMQGVFQAVVLGLTVIAIYGVGRRAGGHGTLAEAIVLMVWLQSIMILAQIVQLVIAVIMPALAWPLGYAALFLFFWLLTSFVTELHGFKSGMNVFVGILATLFLIAVVASILFASLGVQIPGAI